MANTGMVGDIRRSKELRAMAKGLRDPDAQARVIAAADRLEIRAAKKASKIGRKKPKKR